MSEQYEQAEEIELHDNNEGPALITNAGPQKNSTKRDLRGHHVVFITISAVVGAGIYTRPGLMLRVGGPGAVIVAFAILGFLAWTVSVSIAEMVLIWPVSNALVLFVRNFVDDELGTVVGIAYWFCWAVIFPAEMVAVASQATLWNHDTTVQDLAFFIGPPLVLVIFNTMSVKWYGWLEVVGGSAKLLFLAIVSVSMILINRGVGPDVEAIGDNLWQGGNVTLPNGTIVSQSFFEADPAQITNPGFAVLIAMQMAAVMFTGVEIPAVTAVEVRMGDQSDDSSTTAQPTDRAGDRPGERAGSAGPLTSTQALKFATTRLPALLAILYFIVAMLATLNVVWSDPCLPQQTWRSDPPVPGATVYQTSSIFVCNALASGIPGLPDVFTAFLIITAWSTANTNLYVSSRTIFGLTRDMDKSDHPNRIFRWTHNFFRKLGTTTDGHHVPVPALIFSAVAFCWVPFLHLLHGGSSDAIEVVLEVLFQLGSVSCFLVWACECFAFIRFHTYLKKHANEIEDDHTMPFLQRRRPDYNEADEHKYPWKGPGQPYLAGVALFGCLVIVVLLNGVPLWIGWNSAAFVSAYLAPLAFVVLWVGLKLSNYGLDSSGWRFRNFRKWSDFKVQLDDLNEKRDTRRRYG